MRAIVLPAAAALLSLGALAGEKPYDDRAMIGKIMSTAQGLMHLVPRAYSAPERAAEFKGGKLRAKLTELRVHISNIRKAMRRRGDPAEVCRYRKQMMAITGRLIAEIETYGRNAASLALVRSRIATHMKTEPKTSPTLPKARRWWARYKSLFARRKEYSDLVNSGCRKYLETYNELVKALPAIREEVSSLYESGAMKAAADAAATGASGAPKATDVGSVLAGSYDQLLARSACTHPEFRKAVAGKDAKFLDALRGKLVVWRAMLVESAKEKKDMCVTRVMVGGISYAAELPPDSEAAALLPGASLMIAGELRKAEGQAPLKDRPALPGVAEGGWTFRVTAWGPRADVVAGEPMTLCKWPEGDGKPAAAAAGGDGGAGAE